MKTTLSAIAAVLAFVAMPAVHAQDQSVQIKAAPQHTYHFSPEDFYTFRNEYELQNGQKVAFQQRMAHYYTSVDRGDQEEIYPVSRNVFMTKSGARIEFRDAGETVGIANFERLPMSIRLQANTSVTATR